MQSARKIDPHNGVQHDKTVSLLRLYQGLKRVYDLLDKARAELESVRGAPVCVEGCGLCCERRTPAASLLEASYLVSHPASNGSPGAMQHRAFAWLEAEDSRLTMCGLPRGIRLGGEDRARLGADVAVLTRSRCPFLLSEKTCAVYQHRPLACRAYSVTPAPDHWCRRPIAAMETNEIRAVIGRDTSLGISVQGATTALWRAAEGFGMAQYNKVGMLPALAAELLDSARYGRLLHSGVVADAKLALGIRLPDLFALPVREVVERSLGYRATPLGVNRVIGDMGVGEVR